MQCGYTRAHALVLWALCKTQWRATRKAEGSSLFGGRRVCSLQALWPHQPQDIPTQSAQTLTSLSPHIPAFICSFRLYFSLYGLLSSAQQKLKSLPSLLYHFLVISISNTFSNLNLPLIFSLCVSSCGGGAVRFHSCHAGVHVRSRIDTSVSHMFPQPAAALTAVHSWSVRVCFWVRVGGNFFIEFYVYVCVCMCVSIPVPYMPQFREISAAPYLRRSTLNTRLVKLPRGVAWPCCPHRSFYICHNNNGYQAVSHSVIVPLHYLQSLLLKHWLCYAQRCHWVSMSSLMKFSLSLGASFFSSPKADEPSLHRCDTLPWTAVCRPAVLLSLRVWTWSCKNPVFQTIVQTNEVKEIWNCRR